MNILLLTCANRKEADKIIKSLLEKRLVVCAKRTPVSSSFLWKGKIKSGKEVMVVAESLESKFADIEKEVRQLHSYETFVLVSLPVDKASSGVFDWIKKELKK